MPQTFNKFIVVNFNIQYAQVRWPIRHAVRVEKVTTLDRLRSPPANASQHVLRPAKSLDRHSRGRHFLEIAWALIMASATPFCFSAAQKYLTIERTRSSMT